MRKMGFIFGGLVSAVLALTMAAPAYALTNVSDTAYEGSGLTLGYCSTNVGTVVNFYQLGTCSQLWQAQIQVDGTYAWHPYGYTNLCMTASTTQRGVIKIEVCTYQGNSVVTQQLWFNPLCTGTHYHLISGYYGEDLYETGGENGNGTGLTSQNVCGANGESFDQVP